MENVQCLTLRCKMSVVLPFSLGEAVFSYLPALSGLLTGPQETAIFSLSILWPRFFVFFTPQDGSTCARYPE